MITQVFAIRGATTVDNVKERIYARVQELIIKIVRENGLENKGVEITSIICSSTTDVTAAYPAAAVRDAGFSHVPLFSCAEPQIDGSLPYCVRLLVNVSSSAKAVMQAKHIYLHGAVILRPDLMRT